MEISNQDFNRLCEIARTLNEMEENDLWAELNDIIDNIEEE